MSERKPVGSTRTDKDSIIDLIGDDNTSTPPSNGGAAPGPSTHDLLADIFGTGSSDPQPSSSSSSTAPQRSAGSDIMSLFDSVPAASATSPPPAVAPQSSGSLFDMVTPSPQPQAAPAAQAQAPPPQPAKQQLQTYPAYDKNGLKITLTPKVSPAQPGVIQILARFTATQNVESVNFQVAVPKVSHICLPCFQRLS